MNTKAAPSQLRAWITIARPRNAIKQALVFAPLLAAHIYDPAIWLTVSLVALVLTLAASSAYIENDASDRHADAQHPQKRHRPFAAGHLDPEDAPKAAWILVATAVTIAVLANLPLLPLVAYLFIARIYSTQLKKIAIIDLATLTLLHLLRVYYGAVAAGIEISPWFAMTLCAAFTSMGTLKRYGDLVKTSGHDTIPGREWSAEDRTLTLVLGIASSTATILLGCLYIALDINEASYPSRSILWLVPAALTVLLAYLWREATHGRATLDPVTLLTSRPAVAAAAGACAIAFFGAQIPHASQMLATAFTLTLNGTGP